MDTLAAAVDAIAAETRFSGVVRVDVDGATDFERAYGLADRAHAIPMTVGTQLGVASGSKGFTAVTVAALIETGTLRMETTARSVLGADLPLIGDDVTVEQLLAHRSGIGDYLDEDAGWEVDDYVLPVPVHELAGTEDFVRVLDGYPAKFTANERFSYCNGGFVVLALIAERAAGVPFHDLVAEHVFRPAGMDDTAFLRSDELPGRAAIGYLGADGLRTNVFHLPVRGNGDGGAYTTAADVGLFWDAFFDGRLVPERRVREMIRPHSDFPEESMRYGLGFWLHESGGAVILVGFDPGVSFRTIHDPTRRMTHTVLANTSAGAWPVTKRLAELLVG